MSFSLPHTAHSQDYGFSVGTQFGFVHGSAFEYVYNPPGAEREILSELIWDMKPVFYYGFSLDFSRKDLMSGPGFFASISFNSGIPADSGVMEDRDWYWPTTNNEWTHFSSSTNKTRDFFRLDAAAGASIPVRSYFYFKPFISGSWMRFSFTARDGYRKYPNVEGPLEGDVCEYQQDWFLLAAGVAAGTNILLPFSFNLSFQISPFTYCAAIDNHLIRESDTIFRDYAGWGLFLEPGASVSLKVERIEAALDFSWRFIGRTRGDSILISDGKASRNGEAGTGLSFIDTRLLVKFHF